MKNFLRSKKKITILIFILSLIVFSFVSTKSPSATILLATNNSVNSPNEEKGYIKWVDCNLTLTVLEKTSKLDIDSHNNNEEVKFNWCELIAYLSCKYGNNFKKFKQKDLDTLTQKLRDGNTMEELTKDMKYYSYYLESYTTILKEFIGEYEMEIPNEGESIMYEKRYGIKAFLPIAKGYGYNHYDDFGNSRSYGYKRKHLGNDLMGSIGTPIIAVESGVIEAARLESIWRLENWN